MKNKIALLFLVTSFSMATTPVWAGNASGVPISKPIAAPLLNNLDKNKSTISNTSLDKPLEKPLEKPVEKLEKPEEKRGWFTAKNVIAAGAVLLIVGLFLKFGSDNTKPGIKNRI